MSRWIIDPDHSVAAFAVKHLKVAYVRGQFNSITGSVMFDPSDPASSSVDAAIDVGSLTTGIRKRDEHLMTPDFFDVANYPRITFRSSSVVMTGPDTGKIEGDLSIRGITRRISMDAVYRGPVKSPFGGEITMGFSAEVTVNRFDFDVNWNVIMEDSGFMVDRDVKITIDLEADLSE